MRKPGFILPCFPNDGCSPLTPALACHTYLAVGVAAVSIGLSAYEYASAPGPPQPPNLAQATRAGVEAQASTLADRRALEAAAQQGTTAQYTVHRHNEQQRVGYVSMPELDANGKPIVGRNGMQATHLVKYNPADWQPGGQYYKPGQAAPNVIYRTQSVTVPTHQETADFTGYGEADVQGAIAKKNAATQLALQQKYGPQFIDEALKEEQLADPQGFAARQREYDLIQQEENATPERPVANLLDQQVAEQLHAGKGLDNISDSVLRDAVAGAQASRGQAEGNPEQFAEPLTTGFEGQQRLNAAEQKALGWLSSGATPEDVQYRREQQTLADLSSFVNNRTPVSQFQALSGAQQGPAPFNPGTPLSGQNQNAGPATAGAALSGWGTQLNQAENTANPWLAGISAMLRGAGAVNTAISNPGAG